MKWDCRDMAESRARESWMYKRKAGRQRPKQQHCSSCAPSPADGLYSFSLPGHIQPLSPALPGEPVHPLGLITRLGCSHSSLVMVGWGGGTGGQLTAAGVTGAGIRVFLLAREKLEGRVLQA